MAKQKYYAVKSGRIPGVYRTWDECKQQVNGYPGAIFKSFTSIEEANRYLKEESNDKFINLETDEINKEIESIIKSLDDDEAVAFVDGSHIKEKQDERIVEIVGFGALIITNYGKNKLFKSFIDVEKTASRQIFGELEGVKESILWAVNNKMKKIKIFYDYIGIEKWATGEFKANSPLSKSYVEFIKKHQDKIIIEFHKVSAHSGIKYNEEVDELAKKSLSNVSYKTASKNQLFFKNHSLSNWKIILDNLKNKYLEKNIDFNYSINDDSFRDYLKIIKIESNNETIIIKYYSNDTSYIEGDIGDLYLELIINTLLLIEDYELVIDTLNNYYITDFNIDFIIEVLYKILPNITLKNVDLKIRNFLIIAVYNLFLETYLFDYNELLIPIIYLSYYNLEELMSNKDSELYNQFLTLNNNLEKLKKVRLTDPLLVKGFIKQSLSLYNKLY